MSLDKKILKHIEKDGIALRPGWLFYAQDVSKVVLAIALNLLAALLFGICIALTIHWLGEISFHNFPYVLVVLCILISVLAYESFAHAFSFYRIRFSVGMLIVFFIAISIGYFLFKGKQAENVERKLQSLPLYHMVVPQALWEQEQVDSTS